MHVLEHVICHTQVEGLGSLAQIGTYRQDVIFNARTEADHICFYFTARTEIGFIETIELILTASIVSPLDAQIFLHESFNTSPPTRDNLPLLGGTVYNEMREIYGTPRRQLDAATLLSMLPTGNWHFDPGGDPLFIRQLKFADVQRARIDFLNANNCLILTSSPCDFDVHAHFQSILTSSRSPGTIPALSRKNRSTQYGALHPYRYLADHSSSARIFWRKSIDLGPSSDAKGILKSWALDVLLEESWPAFEFHATAEGHIFEKQMSGSIDLGPRLVWAVTFSTSSDSSPTTHIEQVFGKIVPHLDNIEIRPLLEQRLIALKEELRPTGNRVPSNLFIHARAFLNDEYDATTATEDLPRKIESLMERCEKEGYFNTLFGVESGAFPWTECSVRPNEQSPLSVRSESRFRRRLASFSDALPPIRSGSFISRRTRPLDVHKSTQEGASTRRTSISTNGVVYEHHVIDLSSISTEELPLLPLLLSKLSCRSSTHHSQVQKYLFSQPYSAEATVQAVSLKSKHLETPTKDRPPLHLDIQRRLADLKDTLLFTPSDVNDRKAELLSRPELIATSECIHSSKYASTCIRKWQGVDQLALLTSATSGNIEQLSLQARRLAQKLLECRSVHWEIGDGCTAERIIEDIEQPLRHFGTAPDSIAPPPRRSLITSAFPYTSLSARIADCYFDTTLAASLIALTPILESEYFRPQLARQGGGYGLSFGFDISMREAYLIIDRPASPYAATSILSPSSLREFRIAISEQQFSELLFQTQSRWQSSRDGLNSAIRDIYYRVTNSTKYIESIGTALLNLTKRDAEQRVSDFFRSSNFSVAVCMPESGSIFRHEQEIWRPSGFKHSAF